MTIPDLAGVTVAQLRALLETGKVTSQTLVEAHLAQISRYDAAFGAIRCLASSAFDEAAQSDRTRRELGPRSPIEGIPVLVKDNIDVAGLPTTAGALALEHNMPTTDAPIITALREAGAIILGKTNLSEMANFLTEEMPSGYSSLGGQVLNPYDTSITPSGSSSGCGAAAALGFAPLTVGTETDGSITSPAAQQSIVGMKPTLGLVSRTGIVPIAPSQDTAGPMTRTVADAAQLLAAIAGPDPADPATNDAQAVAAALRELVLDAQALHGTRIGVVRQDPEPDDKPDPAADKVHDAALTALRDAGAHLVEVSLPSWSRDDEITVLHYEFAPSVERYLAGVGPHAQMRSLADIQAWNNANAGKALKFRQVHVDIAVAVDHDRDRDAYQQARERDLKFANDNLLAALGDTLDCLVFPGASGCSWAARAGWPSIVVPAGYRADNRRPVGIMLVSRPWTDARLLQLAYALEQAHPLRRTPFEINPAAMRRL
ncbi:amidase [Rhizocola hellebori]|uniref:Amidase n=1 Tax=Rhizocola hellebori TaxID=1392758 RepID=A0A8J3Q992_9ACTN|nr:amidase family protein [Rhizocola hellebori]GIH05542.1 amidase [Rhizocola hellebori]